MGDKLSKHDIFKLIESGFAKEDIDGGKHFDCTRCMINCSDCPYSHPSNSLDFLADLDADEIFEWMNNRCYSNAYKEYIKARKLDSILN